MCTVLGAEGAVVRLTGAESVPEVEEHHGKIPRSIALDAQGGVLPVAEALLRVDILVGQVHAAGVGDAPVDDHDLAVVAVVHHQREHRHHRVEGDAPDVRPLHAHHKVGGQAQQAAKVVVDQAHVHPLRGLAPEDGFHAVPHFAGVQDKKLHKDGVFGPLQVPQQLGVHGFAAGKILRSGVLPGRVAAVPRQIAAHAEAGSIQPVGLARLLGKVGLVGLVHRLQLITQALGRALVAKGEVQCPAQQRQHPHERDPADLVGAVLVLAHEVQHHKQTEQLQAGVDPHAAGGEGEKRPQQPCHLQGHQHHRDGDPIEDAAEKFYDRQPEHQAPSFRSAL